MNSKLNEVDKRLRPIRKRQPKLFNFFTKPYFSINKYV